MSEFENFFPNSLKAIPIQEIEAAIAKAIGELVGSTLTGNVSKLELNFVHGASMQLTLARSLEKDGLSF